MNVVKEIQRINEKQLQLGSNSSWHDQYKDSAYIFVGGLDVELTEGDVIAIFSQYGEVADINMPRDKQTNKPRGFAFLMYEDQRSTVLAVDNFNGAKVLERTLRVDHVDKYKQLEKGEDGKFKEREAQSLNARPELFNDKDDDDSGSDSSHPSIDLEDPMAAYLLEQKRAKKKKSSSSKHAGETKEERKARRARKKEKKRLKNEIKQSLKEEKQLFGPSNDRRRPVERSATAHGGPDHDGYSPREQRREHSAPRSDRRRYDEDEPPRERPRRRFDPSPDRDRSQRDASPPSRRRRSDSPPPLGRRCSDDDRNGGDKGEWAEDRESLSRRRSPSPYNYRG